jgi:hypothetical protein
VNDLMRNEDGAVLVISVIVILVLILLSTALVGSINNNISFTKRHENDVKAFYAAEAGIEKGINMVWNNNSAIVDLDSNVTENLFSNEKISDNNSAYFDLDVIKLDDNTFQFNSIGYNNLERKIEVEIDISNSGGETLKAVEDVFLTVKNFETNVDSFLAGADIENLEKEDFDDYIDTLDMEDVNYHYGDMELSSSQYDSIADNYSVLYVEGDLDINDNGNNNYIDGNEEEPLIIIATGKISLEGIRGISNSSFFTLDDFEYKQPNAHVNFENIFIYTGGNANLTKSSGNGNSNGAGAITTSPHFDFSGKIYSQKNITVYSKDGNVENGRNIYIPQWFNKYGINNSLKIEIVSWQEN